MRRCLHRPKGRAAQGGPRPRVIQAQSYEKLAMEVGSSFGYDIHEHQSDARLKVGHALRRERLAMQRPVLVGRADQFDRPCQLRAARPAKDSDLDHGAGHF